MLGPTCNSRQYVPENIGAGLQINHFVDTEPKVSILRKLQHDTINRTLQWYVPFPGVVRYTASSNHSHLLYVPWRELASIARAVRKTTEHFLMSSSNAAP
ncbi:unnamed protein product [Laminaria digitata]